MQGPEPTTEGDQKGPPRWSRQDSRRESELESGGEEGRGRVEEGDRGIGCLGTRSQVSERRLKSIQPPAEPIGVNSVLDPERVGKLAGWRRRICTGTAEKKYNKEVSKAGNRVGCFAPTTIKQ